MRVLTQIFSLWFGMCLAFHGGQGEVTVQQPIYTNTIQRFDHSSDHNGTHENEVKALKKVFLSNRSITCNDGSQAGFYLRRSHSSTKWIIFLEGGWYCYDVHTCRNRWLKQRHYMTSSKWPETKDVGGLLSPNMKENPFWWNANHVFVPYCTSDSWSGTKPPSSNDMFSFMGSFIVRQVVRDLIPLGLENSTDLILSGSSAGGTGVMLNLDYVKELLHEELMLTQINVRGVTDSGWFLDRTPYTPTNKPAVEAIRKGMEMWRGKVPRRCREEYMNEPWRCYFGYRLYPTLKSELFVFQWLFDEAQMDVDNVGAPVTKQQWDYIHKMGDALRHSFQNVSAVFAPACISHSVLTKRDWQNVKIDDISIAEALHCWEQKTARRRLKRVNNGKMLGNMQGRMGKRKRNQRRNRVAYEGLMDNDDRVGHMQNAPINMKRRRRNRKNKRPNKNKIRPRKQRNQVNNENKPPHNSHNFSPLDKRPSRSVLQNSRWPRKRRCIHRRLERCSWPQCNHSCPKLHNPFTGEEMDFIELLKSFGLDMNSVADALGIDIQTLNNMDHSELLNLLTQQSN
ncbi:palmitoleoyl-protein carboxylesterase NOTUM [Diabrotica virgifera virgifera]|uniref:Palmitoleoyl-protein carboxylesterase NOTUM n=1 Tax=Diabrotica virgifera virgifera TaxID=50390 RepID=A0ABM5KZP8_DIAVI|nr:palmitoleoyl-protein carboxylesterase NOTUM [Diabrotica virgifera virgifera]